MSTLVSTGPEAANTEPSRKLIHPDEQPPRPASSDEVREALSALLQSPPLRSTKQLQKLLQFIVSETVAGRSETLKERVIGTTVFDRRPNYDTNDDPTVRLRVAELRKRLAVYYQANPQTPVVISIPSGSFRAVFERGGETVDSLQAGHLQELRHMQAQLDSAMHLQPVVPGDRASWAARFQNPTWWIPLAVLAIAAAAAIAYLPSAETRAFTGFWDPVLRDPQPVLIHIGNNTVYELSWDYVDDYFRQHPEDSDRRLGFDGVVPMAPGSSIAAEDLHPANNVYHTNGDVTAAVSVTSVLARLNKQFDLRYGSDIAYGALRQSPAILIGAHNNFWTMSMTQNLRFGFEGRDAIVDHSNPHRRWLRNHSDTEDYAILSRLQDSNHGHGFIAIAGIGPGGTSAAAAFLANPRAISDLARTLPTNWQQKNIQLVLHTTVKNQIPSPADVVDTYLW